MRENVPCEHCGEPVPLGTRVECGEIHRDCMEEMLG